MPAKAKRATGAGAGMDDMQDGDDIEAITAVSSWMYEFCSRNNMVDAMYGRNSRNAARAPPPKNVNIRCHREAQQRQQPPADTITWTGSGGTLIPAAGILTRCPPRSPHRHHEQLREAIQLQTRCAYGVWGQHRPHQALHRQVRRMVTANRPISAVAMSEPCHAHSG
jgi:predicted CxxxxCH...CXXCH cytochrome family protein